VRYPYPLSNDPIYSPTAPVNVNTTGQPSTILNYDADGNPVYTVPPPGQQITGYDSAGNPLYGGAQSGATVLQTSTIIGYSASGTPIYGTGARQVIGYSATGQPIYGTSASAAGQITSYDEAGNPVYSTPPSGQTVVGYDSYGNPIYSGSAAAASALTSAAAAAPALAPTTAPTGDYQSVLDWLSESTLISGVPNWGIAAGVGALLLVISRRGGR
jgi:hypothetical protein